MSAPPAPPPVRPGGFLKWHRRVLGIFLVVVAFEVGLVLLIAPWLARWETTWAPTSPGGDLGEPVLSRSAQRTGSAESLRFAERGGPADRGVLQTSLARVSGFPKYGLNRGGVYFIEVAMTSQDVIVTYIQDAEAAERNFEDTLAAFAKTGEQDVVKNFFERASARAKTQHERLEKRLRELGGSPSSTKSILAHMLAFSTTAAQIGQSPGEKNTQHLIMCVGAAAAEMAMYESLATVAGTAGDGVTERLARELQTEEKDDFDKAWALLAPSAEDSFTAALAKSAQA